MILIIDNYDSFTYNLYQYVAQLTDAVSVVRNDKISVAEIKALRPKGIILSPGPGRPENAGICIELIKKLSKFIPILGVCLGHQAITVAFGGKVVNCSDIVHGKSTLIYHNKSVLYQEIPLSFQAARYHSLIAEKESLPDVLQIEAQNQDGQIMAIRHKARSTFGVQFHPESILTDHGNTLLKNFISICNKETESC